MYSRSTMYDAPDRAENVLRRYRDLCTKDMLRNKPDEYSYSLILKAWYVKRYTYHFNKVHLLNDVYTNSRTTSRREDGVAQAASRLDWMRDLNEDASLPDVVKVRYFFFKYSLIEIKLTHFEC